MKMRHNLAGRENERLSMESQECINTAVSVCDLL